MSLLGSSPFIGNASRSTLFHGVTPPAAPIVPLVGSAAVASVVQTPKPSEPPVTVPAAVAEAIAATKTVAAEAEKAAAQTGRTIISQNVAATKETAAKVAAAVAAVSSAAETQAAVKAALAVTPAKRAQVAAIATEAAKTIAGFQLARTTDDGAVVTAKSPAKIVNDIVPPENPTVPKLIGKPSAPAVGGGGGGGTSYQEGTSPLVFVALAVAAMFLIKV